MPSPDNRTGGNTPMGTTMKILNSGAVIDGFARDGREFGHVTENLRDALLNGAENVEFRIQGLTYEKECVARRVIADDGTGMTHAVLASVYSNLSVTGTDKDFDVILNDDGTVAVSAAPTTIADGEHQRRGFGGRASNIGWNPFGVATVTVHDGIARMVWMYRGFGGNPEMREWNEDGVKRSVIAPYTEPKLLTYEDLMVDQSFSKMLLVTGGQAPDEATAEAMLGGMAYGEVLENPLADIEWDGDVVPKWIIDHYDEDGIARREDGTLAHGTVKILLGRSPYDSTAMTGDPAFIGESDFTKYNGAANRSWLTLAPWNVRIWSLTRVPRTRQEVDPDHPGEKRDARNPDGTVIHRPGYKLLGYPDKVRLDAGATAKVTPSGRRQWGALGLRLRPTSALPDPIAHRSVLDLGKYGTALLVLRRGANIAGDTVKTSSDDLYGSTRKGVVAVVYGNELHGIAKDDLETPNWVFQNMGIPMNDQSRDLVSLFLFLPRKTTTTPGVFQAAARDRLKWSGSDGLPMTGDNGINKAIAEALPAEFYALVTPRTDGDAELPKEWVKKLQNLWRAADDNQAAGSAAMSAHAAANSALLADGSPAAVYSGAPAGDQGKPGSTERPACEECGLKIHAADCPRKRAITSGGLGGTRGRFQTLTAEEGGPLMGRKSRAKAAAPQAEETPDLTPPLPPEIHFQDTPPDPDRPEMPIVYTRPGVTFPATGALAVNRDHVAVHQLFGIASKCGRDSAGTKAATETWIKQQLAAVTLGVFALHSKPLTKDAAIPTVQTPTTLIEKVLVRPETWFMALAAMYFNEASLKSYITGHVAQRAPKRAA